MNDPVKPDERSSCSGDGFGCLVMFSGKIEGVIDLTDLPQHCVMSGYKSPPPMIVTVGGGDSCVDS